MVARRSRRLRVARSSRRRRTPNSCSPAPWSCIRPATCSARSTTTRRRSPSFPKRADALSNLGAAYVRLGQYDEAIAQYEAALKTDPLNTAVRLNLALAFYKSARPNDAIPQLKRVLAAEPEAQNAYLVLADCYLQTGQDKEVVALLQPREQMFGARSRLRLPARHRAAPRRTTRRRAELRRSHFRSRRVGRGAPAAWASRYLASEDFRAAKTELEQAVKLNPKLPTAHSLYGRALLALGEQEAAERAFRRELEFNVNDFEANLQLGTPAQRAQRFDDASTYLERALPIRPSDLTARKLLANLRLQTGRDRGSRGDARSDRQGGARLDRGRTSSWRRPTTG